MLTMTLFIIILDITYTYIQIGFITVKVVLIPLNPTDPRSRLVFKNIDMTDYALTDENPKSK